MQVTHVQLLKIEHLKEKPMWSPNFSTEVFAIACIHKNRIWKHCCQYSINMLIPCNTLIYIIIFFEGLCSLCSK